MTLRTVVLIDLPWMRDKDPRVPLGQASIAAALSDAGVPFRRVTLPVNGPATTQDDVLRAVERACRGLSPSKTDLGIGAFAWNEHIVRPLVQAVRERGLGRVILGGPQVSYADAGVVDLYPGVDAIVRGAGEYVLGALARTDRSEPIEGVAWAGQPDLQRHARVPLEQLPSPFLSGVVPVEPGAFLRWETQRGCPFTCSFCQHREPDVRLRGVFDGQRVRAEIELFCSRSVADVAVLDPIFNSSDRGTRLLRELERAGYRGKLSLQCRAEMVDAAFLDAAAALDTRLEFGLQTVHSSEGRAVLRANNMRLVDRALAEVRRQRVPFEVSLIFGLPNQTLESFRASVAHCLHLGVPTIKAFPLVLLRGTRLERDRRRWGLVENDSLIPAVVTSHTFDEADWQQMAALSSALQATEGNHPPLPKLLALADDLVASSGRFSPLKTVRARG